MDKELEAISADTLVYEVGYHILPIVAEDHVGEEVTRVRDIIESAGGKLIADEFPKHMDLAYPMVKSAANKRTIFHSAYFGWMKFDATPAGAKAIDAALKKNGNILRFILAKTVRENTMVPKKFFMKKTAEESPRAEEKKDAPQMTEAELDKTIEELVIS